MTTFEEYLKSKTGPGATGTKGTPVRPPVTRLSDVMGKGFNAPAPSGSFTKYEPKKPEGFMGFLQDVMESPIGKVFTAAGEVISIPGRVLPSGIQELKDLLDNDPNTQGSFGDFAKQIADPTFGFGTVIGDATDSPWLNRIIGFTGDVLLDPLTYVTFGGNQALKFADDVAGIAKANKFIGKGMTSAAGRKGREALAYRVLDVLEDSDLAASVAKRGRAALSHLDDEAFERLGLNRAGLYFMGKRIKGTEKIGQVAEAGLTNMRTWTGEHVYRRLADVFTEDDVFEARKALRGGYAPPERVTTYLTFVVSENQQRAERALALREANASLDALIRDVGEEQFKANSGTIHRLLEGDDTWVGDNAKVPSTPEEFVAQKIATWFRDRWTEVDTAAKAVDDKVQLGLVEKYFPHVMTDDARRWVTTNESPGARKLREMLFNPLNDAGSFKPRMSFGDEFFGTKLGDASTRTVRNLNEIARKGGFKGDFFETDVTIALRKYANNYAQQRGSIARRKFLVERGIPEKIPTIFKRNPEAIKAGRKMTQGITDNRQSAYKKVLSSLDGIKNTVGGAGRKVLGKVEGDLQKVSAEVINAATNVAVRNQDVFYARQALAEAASTLRQQHGTLQALYDEAPIGVSILEQELKVLTDEMDRTLANIDVLSRNSTEFTAKIAELEAKQIALQNSETLLYNIGEIIQARLDDIIAGKKLSEMGDAYSVADKLRKAAGGRAEVPGSQKKAVNRLNSNLMKIVSPEGDISKRNLVRMKRQQAKDIVERASRGDASIGEMREASLWFAAIFPDIEYVLPEFWQQMFGDGGVMAKAAKADRYHKLFAKAAEKNRKVVRLRETQTNLNTARIDFVDTIHEYTAARRMLDELFGDSTGSLGGQVKMAMLDQDPYAQLNELLSMPQYQPLVKYFETMLDPDLDYGILGVSQMPTSQAIVTRLRGIIDEFSKKVIPVNTSVEGPSASAAARAAKTFNIMMSDYESSIDFLLRYGNDEDIENFISLAVSGKLPEGIDLPAIAKLRPQATGGGRLLRTGERAADMRENISGSIERLGSRAVSSEANASNREALASAAQALGDSDGATALRAAANAERNFVIEPIRQAMRELIPQKAALNSIDGQAAKTRADLKKLFPDVRTELGEQLLEDITPELEMYTLRMSFYADLYARMYDAADVLASSGLTINDETIRLIVNKVAAEHKAGFENTSIMASQAVSELQRMKSIAQEGGYSDPAEMLRDIEHTIINNNLSPIISRSVGKGDAQRIKAEAAYYGGRRMQTKKWEERMQKLLDLEARSTDPSLDEATRKQAETAYKRTMKKSAMLAERKAYFNDVLVPWYESVYGKQTKKPTYSQVFNSLDELTSVARSSNSKSAVANRVKRGQDAVIITSKLGPDSTIAEMTKWLGETVNALSTHGRRARRIVKELNRAENPYVVLGGEAGEMSLMSTFPEPQYLKVDITRMNGDTPRLVAHTIQRVADDLSRATDAVAEKRGLLAQTEEQISQYISETASQADVLRAVLETPVGKRGPISAAEADRTLGVEAGTVAEARDILREVVDLKGTATWAGAKQDEQYISFLQMFADLDISEPLKMQYRMGIKKEVRDAIDSGKAVAYVQTDQQGRFANWSVVENIEEIPDDVFRRHEQGDRTVRIGYLNNRTVNNSGKVRLYDPEKASTRAAERQKKMLDEAKELEDFATRAMATDAQVAMQSMAQAEKIRKRAESIFVNSPTSQGFQNIEYSPDVVVFGRGLRGSELDVIMNKLSIARKNVEPRLNPNTVGNETIDAANERVRIATAQLEAFNNYATEIGLTWKDGQYRLSGSAGNRARFTPIVDNNGDTISITAVDIEALFNTGKDVWVDDIDNELKLLNRNRLAIEQSILTGKVNSITASIIEQQEQYSSMLSTAIRVSSGEPGSPVSRSLIGSYVAKQDDVRRALEDELNRLNRYTERLETLRASGTKEARMAARSKIEAIQARINAGEFTIEELTEAMTSVRRVTPQRARIRKFEVTDKFENSAGGKLLARIAELEQTAGYSLSQGIIRDSNRARSIVANLRAQANKHRDGLTTLVEGGTKKVFGKEQPVIGSKEIEASFMSTLGRVADVTEGRYDAVARYTELAIIGTTTGRSKTPKRLGHAEAVDIIVKEISAIKPTKPVLAPGTPREVAGGRIGSLTAEATEKELKEIATELSLNRDSLDAVSIGLNIEKSKEIALSKYIDDIKGNIEARRAPWAKEQKKKIQAAEKEAKAGTKQYYSQTQKLRKMEGELGDATYGATPMAGPATSPTRVEGPGLPGVGYPTKTSDVLFTAGDPRRGPAIDVSQINKQFEIETLFGSPGLIGHARDTAGWAERSRRGLNYKMDTIKSFLEELETKVAMSQEDAKMIPHLLDFLDESEEALRLIDQMGGAERALTAREAMIPQMPMLSALKADLLNSYYGLLASDNAMAAVSNIQRALDDGSFGRVVKEKIDNGYVSLAHVGLPSYQGQEWLSEMFTNINRIQQPAYSRYLSKFLGKYTGFFKAYAVSTPGFVVRNAISNTFMLFAGGVDIENMNKGLSLYRAWHKAVLDGNEGKWLASLGDKDFVERVIRATDASGYGRAQDAMAAFNPKRRWLVDNKWTNFYMRKNDLVDGSARFIMAYDSVAKGADLNQAVGRVKRYFFDYESVSAGDEFMRGIIPFWFWMSRNLPMQIANMYQNPRAYLMYNKAMKAIGVNDDGDIVPGYLEEQGAVKIGDNWYFAPDVGFNKVGQQFRELTDPMRLLSYVNPGLRVPIELMGNRKFYNDTPFWDKGQDPVGSSLGLSAPVAALAALLGQTAQTEEGSIGVTDKVNYGLSNLIPLLAQGERLIPSTEYGKSRQAGSVLGYLGLPFRQVTEQSREAELRRREREQE